MGLFWAPLHEELSPGVNNDYSAPPASDCICQKEFLPPLNPMFPSQDFREGQSQKTLAYAQALQYLETQAAPTEEPTNEPAPA